MFEPIHQHLLLKARLSDSSLLTLTLEERASKLATDCVEESGKYMLLDIVEAVGMNPVTMPQCVYITDDGNEGVTGSINLAESHIAFHVWDNARLLMIDVYSCKEFESKVVLGVLEVYCPGIRYEYIWTIDRNNGIFTGDDYGM